MTATRLCRLCEEPSLAIVCASCNRKRHAKYRGGTTARRLYTALKQRLRLRREERSKWTLADVEEVLSQWWANPPLVSASTEPRRMHIVAIDAALPLVPENARIAL